MDIIVARATPAGRGALALVRLSGAVEAVRDAVLVARTPWRTGRTRRVTLVDAGGPFDDGVAVWARGPATVTGEDTLEIGLHGNPLLVDRLIRACVAAGARLARPGEFTRRAVEHGKLDLLQAEATDQLVRARTLAGAALARQGLDGALTGWLHAQREVLLTVAAELEARLDYPGDELTLEDDEALVARLAGVVADCRGLAATVGAGRRRVDGARVALVGPVNAGKSSLFNALLGRARALVHATAGTTRDVLEVATVLDEVEVTLLDTAGERVTDDPVEAAGLALARELVGEAELLLVVLRGKPEGVDPVEADILARTADRPRRVVVNGVDRDGVRGARWPEGARLVSAVTGEGLEGLRSSLVEALAAAPGESLQLASERQAGLLLAVAECAEEAAAVLGWAGPAVAAERVTDALLEIDALTGADTREDVLDAVFARFCLGK